MQCLWKGLICCLRFIITIVVLYTSICASAYSQKPAHLQSKRCPIKTINYEQGLSSNALNAVITDAQGLTWVSTSSGMEKFNGYNFQAINPIVGRDTLKINYPVYFMQRGAYSLVIGYRKGILEYDARSNSFVNLIALTGTTSTLLSLIPVHFAPEGIWCFEEKRGIVLYNWRGMIVSLVAGSQTASIQDMLRTEGYSITRKLIASNDSYIFLRLSDSSLLQVNLGTHQSKKIAYPAGGIVGISCNNTRIFIASKSGLGSIEINSGRISSQFPYRRIIDIPVTRSSIECFDNRLLVTIEKRLFEFDTACICQKEIVSLDSKPLLSSGYIQVVYEDNFHRIWLITHADLKRIEDAETPFQEFKYPNEKDNFIRCIYYDREENIVIGGAYNGAIHLFDSAGNALWTKPLTKRGLTSIMAIDKTSTDNYLVITQGHGIFSLNRKLRQLATITQICPEPLGSAVLQNEYSNNIQRINDSTIYICTRSNVFACHVEKNLIGANHPLLTSPNSPTSGIYCFLYTSERSLWTAAASGILQEVDSSGKTTIMHVPNAYVVRCMAEDGYHNVWVGTERGIFIFNERGLLIHQINRSSGLLSDFIYSLQPEDGRRTSFFASTNFGLSYISGDGTVKNFTRELGLQENEFNTQSSTISPNGKLFFGGIDGITAFYPNSLETLSDSTVVNVTRLVINDSVYNANGGAVIGDSIRLPYDRNHILFDLAATGLRNTDEYMYRYRLAGFEKNWQTTTKPTEIRYTLQPGRYTLEVSCSPILFSKNTFQKQFTIIIDPPFWKTWWFIALSIFGGVLLVTASSFLVLRQRYAQRLRRIELNQQIVNERERISRELHDNIASQLTYISNNIDWIVESGSIIDKAEEQKRLSIMNDTAKALVTDLRETIWAMKKESIMLDELADKLKNFLQAQVLIRPNLNVTISEKILQNYTFSPTEALNIFRTCQEAVTNSIQHANAESLFVNIAANGHHHYSIEIKDDGIGFDRTKEFHGHYGLENMAARATEAGAALEITSAPGRGTTVVIKKVT